MSATFEIKAQPRIDTGKGASRRLRRTGLIPAIVYGAHKDPQTIQLSHSDLLLHLEHEAFYSHVLDLFIGDAKESVILKDLQRHPAKPFVLHADFQRVQADEKIRKQVPLHFINEAGCPGVKMGGSVSHTLTHVEITCLPKDLPEFIAVDMANMDTGSVLHLADLPLPEGVELAHTPDADATVTSIHGPSSAAPGEEEAAG